MNDERTPLGDIPIFNVPMETTPHQPLGQQPQQRRDVHRPAAADHLLRDVAGDTTTSGAADLEPSEDDDLRVADERWLTTPIDAVNKGLGVPTEWTHVDWDVVDQLVRDTSAVLEVRRTNSMRTGTRVRLTPAQQEQEAREAIQTAVRARAERDARDLGAIAQWKATRRISTEAAVYAAMYGLGQLQPLLDDQRVENIFIIGNEAVVVQHGDGTRHTLTPIVSHDDDLIAIVGRILEQNTVGGRSWTNLNPDLDLDLPGGARLAATMGPALRRPSIVIRAHRLVDIGLEDLVARRALTPSDAQLLNAAVLSNLPVVISGEPGSGKTTLMRALGSCLDPLEPVATIEKDRELHFDRMPHRHQLVFPFQYHPGGDEFDAAGRRRGEYTLQMAMEKSLRLSLTRIFVGEVRGSEILSMFQAMQAGAGSISTIHADNAHDAISRMVTLSMATGIGDERYASRLVAQHIRLIVHQTRITLPSGEQRRVVGEISEVVKDNNGDASTITLLRYDPEQQRLVFQTRPTDATVARLVGAGADPRSFIAGGLA